MWNDTLWNSGICEAVLIRNGKSIRLERIHLKTGVFVDAKCFLLFRQTDIFFYFFRLFYYGKTVVFCENLPRVRISCHELPVMSPSISERS